MCVRLVRVRLRVRLRVFMRVLRAALPLDVEAVSGSGPDGVGRQRAAQRVRDDRTHVRPGCRVCRVRGPRPQDGA